MATRSLVQLRGLFESLPGGSKNISPPDMQNNSPPGVETQLVLASGLNTVNLPAVSTVAGAIIVFDSTSTVAKTILGAAADTGLRADPSKWTVLTFDPAALPTNFIITAGAADTGKTTSIIFF